MKIKTIFQISLLLFILFSCSKDTEEVIDPSKNSTVYVLGLENAETLNANFNIWKNGESINKTNATKSWANSFIVNKGNIYVGGNKSDNGNTKATLWKNGTFTYLTSEAPLGSINDIHIINNDVYAVGYVVRKIGESGIGVLWKNGKEIFTVKNPNGTTSFSAIDIVESDIYIVGYENDGKTNVPKVWVNEKVVESNFKTNSRTILRDIKVSNKNTYIIGNVYNGKKFVATLWKNGIVQNLTDGTRNAKVKKLIVDKDNTYVVGFETVGNNQVARLWKNGNVIDLVKTDSKGDSEASDIFVKNNTVYIAFSEYDSKTEKTIAKLWQNGKTTNLSDKEVNTYSLGVFVE